MTERPDDTLVAPSGAKALDSIYEYVMQSNLPPRLVDLVYLRISQMNNCAFCLDVPPGLQLEWTDLTYQQ